MQTLQDKFQVVQQKKIFFEVTKNITQAYIKELHTKNT